MRWPTDRKSRYAEGDERADVVKEATVPQVTSLPIPTTEAAPGPAKDVTVGDKGAVNGKSASIVSDPLPPPTPEDDGCTSCGHGVHKRIVEHRW